MESSEECWSAEQLRAAEAQIEEQKKAWELKRLAALSGNDDECGQLNDSTGGIVAEPDGGLLTYAHRDSINQVKRKPGRPRTKSNFSTPVVSQAPRSPRVKSEEVVRKRRNRSNGVGDDSKMELSVDTTVSETDDSHPCTPATPGKKGRRKRNRGLIKRESTTTTPDVSLSDDSSHPSNNSKALSPRTRSRGTVNINLWTLDVKPLIGGAKTIPSPKMVSIKVKDGCSPVPANDVFANGCESENYVPTKKVKRAHSTDLDNDPDLDVVS